MEKLTNAKALEMVLGMESVQANAALVEKLETMLKGCANKYSEKQRKAMRLNEELKVTICEEMEKIGYSVQVKDFMKLVPRLEVLYSNQKLSSLFNALVKEGKLTKSSLKGVTYFSPINPVEFEELDEELLIEEQAQAE